MEWLDHLWVAPTPSLNEKPPNRGGKEIMIVQRTWITRKYKHAGFVDGTQNYCVRRWRGYFLFGILPLYIVNYETTYS